MSSTTPEEVLKRKAEQLSKFSESDARHAFPLWFGVLEDAGRLPEFKPEGHSALPARVVGDYFPGWDDRKELAETFQNHAPLPEEGLSERVYDALIAVAQWGYAQRVEEEE